MDLQKKKKKQIPPKWFKGMVYEKGEEVTNPFSGDSYKLTGLELSLYDFIMGCQFVFESTPKTNTPKRINEFNKALNWFRVNNPEAYYVLLDQQQFSLHVSSYSKGTGFSWYDKYDENVYVTRRYRN